MEINKILRYIVLAGLFLVPFIAFFVSETLLFPFITGKNFAFRIIIEIIFGAWCILALLDSSHRPKKHPLLIVYSVFLLVVIIADSLSVNAFRSFWSNFERMDGLITQIHLFLYFIVLIGTFKTEKMWSWFLNTSIVASVLMCGYGFMQLAGKFDIHQGSVRVDGSLGNATYLAVYLLIHLFLTLFFLLRTPKEKIWLRVSYGVAMILQMIILYYTATRGAILGFIGGIFLTLLILAIFEKEHKKLRKTSLIVAGALVVLVLAFLALKDKPFVVNSPVLSRFAAISATERTTQSRFTIWNMAWQGVKEHPLLGWGQENFILVFEKHYDPEMYNQEPWFDRTHNVILDWLVSAGFLGLIAYLSLFVVSLYIIWKKKSDLSLVEKAIFTGLLVGYFFHNLFVFDNLVSYIYFATILAYLTHRTSGHDEVEKNHVGKNHDAVGEGAKTVLIPLAILLVPLSVYFLNIPQIISSAGIINALRYEQAAPNQSLQYFKDVFAADNFAKGEAREQLIQSGLRVAGMSNVPNDFKQTYALYAVDQMTKEIKENPFDARYPFFLGEFYLQLGASAQAKEMLTLAQKLSPKKQDILLSLGVAYYLEKDPQKAFSIIQDAYNLEPRYENVRLMYAVISVYAGKPEITEKVLSEQYHTLLYPDPRIVEAYVQSGQILKFIADDKSLVDEEQKAGKLSDSDLSDIDAKRKQFMLMVANLKK